MRIVVVLLAAALSLPAHATQPNPSARQKALIDQLITLTHLDDSVRKIMDQSIEAMLKESGAMSAEDKKDWARYRQLLREKLDYGQLVRELYEPIYAKYFTEEQLADIVTFYKTPTGQRMMQVLPDIMREGMEAAQPVMGDRIKALLGQVAEERKKRIPWEQTMADIRMIATAAEAYATDENKYPAASTLEELRKILEPTYVKKMPMKDVWGNEYAYVVSEDREHYRIVSAGSDNAFEFDSRRVVLKPQPKNGAALDAPKLSDLLADDIIYQDGTFIQVPRESQKDQ